MDLTSLPMDQASLLRATEEARIDMEANLLRHELAAMLADALAKSDAEQAVKDKAVALLFRGCMPSPRYCAPSCCGN